MISMFGDYTDKDIFNFIKDYSPYNILDKHKIPLRNIMVFKKSKFILVYMQ